MLKKTLTGIVLVVVCFGGFLAYNKYETQQQYNYNISTNDKPVGQNDLRERMTFMPVASFDDLLQYTDIVVEGEVTSEGILAYDGYPKVQGAPDDHELNRKEKDVAVTLTQFKVTKVLFGELDTDIITIYQYGPPNTDIGELKITKDQKLICFLRKAGDEEGPFKDAYPSAGWELGFYDISNENSTKAFSNVNGLCRYDNRPASALSKAIEDAIKRREKLTSE